jgi:hypothetical protein
MSIMEQVLPAAVKAVAVPRLRRLLLLHEQLSELF